MTNATREIVRGVRFTINFVMKESNDDSEIFCEIVVLEKPWLIKNNRKFSEMSSNNCSLPVTNDRFHYVVNQAFVNTKSDPENVDDQIIKTTIKKSAVEMPTTASSAISSGDEDETTTEASSSPVLSGNSMSFLDSLFNVNNFLPPPSSSSPSPATLENFTMTPDGESETEHNKTVKLKTVEHSQNSPVNLESLNGDTNINGSSESISDKNVFDVKNLEVEIKKAFSELFQTDPEFQAKFISLLHRTDDTNVEENSKFIVNILTNHMKSKFEVLTNQNQNQSVARAKRSSHSNIRDLTEEALDTLDKFDVDDNKRMILNIVSVTDLSDNSKHALQIEVEIANSKCHENSQEIEECKEKIEEHTKKICLLEVTIR